MHSYAMLLWSQTLGLFTMISTTKVSNHQPPRDVQCWPWRNQLTHATVERKCVQMSSTLLVCFFQYVFLLMARKLSLTNMFWLISQFKVIFIQYRFILINILVQYFSSLRWKLTLLAKKLVFGGTFFPFLCSGGRVMLVDVFDHWGKAFWYQPPAPTAKNRAQWRCGFGVLTRDNSRLHSEHVGIIMLFCACYGTLRLLCTVSITDFI